MTGRIVITGIGMVTPLGQDPGEVLRRVEAGESAAAPPTGFDASPFACPVCAEVKDFQPQRYVVETKMVRLMNRDAQLAVAAAHLALQDARLTVGADYQPQDIALYGATGMAGLPLGEVTALVRNSTGADGHFDPHRFGQQGLKSISPLLSFKVLGNMPVCFVSICENIQGPNCIYTPWESQGAQAIEAGIRAIECGDARCALVGGCDVKTHELAFIALEQRGFFNSWKETQTGVVPGEGAVFLVLEEEAAATARGARAYARMAGFSISTRRQEADWSATYAAVLKRLQKSPPPSHPLTPTLSPTGGEGARRAGEGDSDARIELGAIVAAGEADDRSRRDEAAALASLAITAETVLYPKQQIGNLFAAAAALQVGMGALLAQRLGQRVLANCFGHGSEQGAFLLEKR